MDVYLQNGLKYIPGAVGAEPMLDLNRDILSIMMNLIVQKKMVQLLNLVQTLKFLSQVKLDILFRKFAMI